MKSYGKSGVGRIGESLSPIKLCFKCKGKIRSNYTSITLNSFDMMGRRVDKMYTNVTNLIFRLSNGTSIGKEHALLVNAHLVSNSSITHAIFPPATH